ncbi:MAG: nucleotidyltransferase domain-containing protein [Alphaproteobacteria bacterium]|nr:nucleotidyltransferase domain-containing protein [Alphaproteobacteria bacterium]
MDFVADIPPDMRSEILGKLRRVEETERVRVLFAIESGSRAWGFPSPDSDFDARFVYVRERDWYLSITPGRDVIELPIEGDLDINGWDVKKALELLLKPNPVLLEWLSSPIRYLWDDGACEALNSIAARTVFGPACLHHYLNLGEGLWNRHIAPNDRIKLKKYFYILRPAMALRWIRTNPDVMPPMNFQQLMAGVDVPEAVEHAVLELLEAKQKTKELGLAARVPVIDDFVTKEFGNAKTFEPVRIRNRPRLKAEADNLFRHFVNEKPISP